MQATAAPSVALEILAALFDPHCYATALLTGQDRTPVLTVTSRHLRLRCEIHTEDGWYWTPEPTAIAPTTDPDAAALHLAYLLGGTGSGSWCRRRGLLAAAFAATH